MLFKSKKPGVSWIVVFLGNPGAKYDMTRHNAGFMTADAFAEKHGIKISRLKFRALTETCTVGDETVLLMKPQTFMNLSGDAASEAMKFYKVPLEHVLVVSDDISLPVGKLRIRRSGSAGGHNGLKDIIAKCGGDGFPRIKLGVGSPPHPDYDIIDWVLSVFRDKDAEDIKAAAGRAADAVVTLITQGVDKAMNEYN
ncbi:MAG: aminoacyl-tRNA hydrolase [Oscillospiraceae bacterium]